MMACWQERRDLLALTLLWFAAWRGPALVVSSATAGA